MLRIKASLLASLLLTLNLSFAELNKWVDSEGNTHYGDSVPNGAKTQKIDSSTMSSMDSQAANKGIQELNKTFDAQRKLEQRQQQRQTKEDNKKKRKIRRCAYLKADLNTLQKQVRVYSINNDGGRDYLSDDQRKKDIAKIKSTIKKNCS